MPVPLITVLPDPPLKTSPSDFASKADTFLDALPDFCDETNAAITEMNSLGDDIEVSVTEAAASVVLAEGSAASALSNSGASLYNASTTYGIADSVIGTDGNTYRCITAGTVGDNPVGSVTGDWVQITYISGEFLVKDADFTAADREIYFVDTGSNSVEVVLPASPSDGASLFLYDYLETFDLNEMIINNNGNKLMGLMESMTVDIRNVNIGLIYVAAISDWRRFQ